MGSSRGSLPPLHRTRLRLATSPAANIPAQDNRKHANLMAWAAPMSPSMPPAATLLALSNPATTLLKQLPRTSNPRSRVPQARKASSLSRPPHLLTVRLTRQQPTKITPRRCMAKTVCPTQRALALHIRPSQQTQLRQNNLPGTTTPHFQTWKWGPTLRKRCSRRYTVHVSAGPTQITATQIAPAYTDATNACAAPPPGRIVTWSLAAGIHTDSPGCMTSSEPESVRCSSPPVHSTMLGPSLDHSTVSSPEPSKFSAESANSLMGTG